MKESQDKYSELQARNNSLLTDLQNEKTTSATFSQRITLLEEKCEDATASAASSAFSIFAQQDFKELAIRTNQEHYELISELFQTLDDIFETHTTFGKMSIILEDQVEKREQASKFYDNILDWKRYIG